MPAFDLDRISPAHINVLPSPFDGANSFPNRVLFALIEVIFDPNRILSDPNHALLLIELFLS